MPQQRKRLYSTTFAITNIALNIQRKNENLKKIQKQVYDLTLDDLKLSEVWEYADDEEGLAGQDEATVRPYDCKTHLAAPDGIFMVSAAFMLADGSVAHGYLTPPFHEPNSLVATQPAIITDGGQVMFYCGTISPSELRQ